MTVVEHLRTLPRKVLRAYGLDVVAYPAQVFPPDFSADDIRTFENVREYTMTSPERVVALVAAVRYISRSRVPGAFVECGVWRGGSMMAVARTLIELNDAGRDLFLFDTFDGMPKPGEQDIDCHGNPGLARFTEVSRGEDRSAFCCAPLDDVKRNLSRSGYSGEHPHYVKVKFEFTIPAAAPSEIALLRLDTDWYESTRHELAHLFPRVSHGGAVIIDDYGHWQGARRARDEYFATTEKPVLLNRIDYTGRLILKV